jgi:transcriptional regulator with XRE-family HTH domain
MKRQSTLAKRLKEARLRAGISQKRLGILAGIDEFVASARINQYETGKHAPELETAERLAKVLDVPTPYLYSASDELAHWILAYRLAPRAERRDLISRVKRALQPEPPQTPGSPAAT